MEIYVYVWIYSPGVILLDTSPKGEELRGLGLLCWTGAGAEGDTHIGVHLRLLLGLPWLCTGSNSRVLLRVAQAIFNYLPGRALVLGLVLSLSSREQSHAYLSLSPALELLLFSGAPKVGKVQRKRGVLENRKALVRLSSQALLLASERRQVAPVSLAPLHLYGTLRKREEESVGLAASR